MGTKKVIDHVVSFLSQVLLINEKRHLEFPSSVKAMSLCCRV